MSISKNVFAAFLILLFLSVTPRASAASPAGESESQPLSDSLRGEHNIELCMGLLSKISTTNQVFAGGLTAKSKANGFLGSVAYTYWLRNEVGIGVSAGVLSADATVTVSGLNTSVESAAVFRVLFGVKYEPLGLAVSDVMRPYASASVGPYVGSASNVRAGLPTATESFSEMVIGARIGAGVDLSLSKLFMISVGAGYCLVGDFENRVGSQKNYSSPEFSVSFGVVFGRGK